MRKRRADRILQTPPGVLACIEEFAQGLPEAEAAFLEYEGRIHFATRPRRQPGEPDSAIIRLIQGIQSSQPEMARRILRSRIFSTQSPTSMCRAMVKVAAKRLTAISNPSPAPRSNAPMSIFEELERIEVRPALPPPLLLISPNRVPDPMATALQMARSIPQGALLHQCDRPVAALLLGPDGAILGGSLNTNSRDRTRHAEVNLIQGWYARTGLGIPSGARIFVTLKPCQMCSAMILECAENRNAIQVLYADDDPGPQARNTCLDGTPALLRWNQRNIAVQ